MMSISMPRGVLSTIHLSSASDRPLMIGVRAGVPFMWRFHSDLIGNIGLFWCSA